LRNAAVDDVVFCSGDLYAVWAAVDWDRLGDTSDTHVYMNAADLRVAKGTESAGIDLN
jgi:hypothetical protein